MLKVIFFDLDGTLLPLDIETFLQDYTRAIASKVAHLTDPKLFIRNLLYATDKMLQDKDPATSNQEVFWKYFLRNDDTLREQLIPVLDEFYKKDFPLLGKAIEPDSQVPGTIKKLKARGYRLVLATNAVFPREAVVERLRWALIEPGDFELITSYENMHFCKPHIEYYQEILSCVKEAPENCMMVGNDVEEDMIAGQLGLKTFLVDTYVIHRGTELPYDHRGSLKELEKLLCPEE